MTSAGTPRKSHAPHAEGLDVAALLDALEDPAVLFDAQGRIAAANRAAAGLVDQEAAELVGLTRAQWEALLSHALRPDARQSGRRSSRGYPVRWFEPSTRAVGADETGAGSLELIRDVTAAVKAEEHHVREALRHQREMDALASRLELAEKFKMELTANVTHDLRTPLASIKASISGLLAGDVSYDPQAFRETLSLVEEETDRLQRRVQNLLSMARMEAGDQALSRDWSDITDILACALESLSSIRGSREVRLDYANDLPLVFCDYDQVLIAVRNLLENAFLYSPAGSAVEIGVSQGLGQIRIRVRDFGPGLLPDEFERVFDKFYRGLSARRIPGTGLGLPICRGIAEAHGGRLWAEHVSGGGVAFVLSLPIEGTQQTMVEAST